MGNKVGNEAITRDFLSENIPNGEILRNANDILPDSRLQLLEKTVGGIELGSYLFIGNCLQVVGLESIPADRAAFLVQLTTVMVPILQATFARDFSFIPSTTWVACILAFAGVIIMGFDDGPGGLDVGEELFHRMGGDVVTHGFLFSGGDTLIILAALCYSMHVIRLGKYAKLTNPLELAASKATVEAILSVALVLGLLAIPSWIGDSIQLFPLVENESRDIQMYFSQLQYTISEGTFPPDGFLKAIAASLWTGLVTCAYTIYAQSFGQRRVDPTDANLIYTMQPIFSAIFAWALLGESLGGFGYTGATLIGVALWIVTSNKGRG
jgi:drug/metabolite transporter (DMT)-like permease